MNKIAKINIMLLVVTFFVQIVLVNKTYAKEAVDIFGKYAASIDASSGEVLFDKAANEKAYPASVTKVMTALLLMEKVKPDEKITLTENAIGKTRSNSQILFKAGETLDRDNALYAMMVISANDVATSVGEHIAGSEEAFGEMMTQKAKELGALNTHFANPSGLHDPNHYTTAYDMALIGREAIKNPAILNAMGMKKVTLKTSNQEKEIVNPSKIHDDPNALGGKTGFTDEARNTLMKIDEVDGKKVVNVVFRSSLQNVYVDIKKISDYSMEQLENKLVVDKTKWSETLTFLEKPVIVKPEKDVYLTKKKSDTQEYQTKFIQGNKMTDEILYNEGIKKGDKLGEIEILKGGKKVSSVNVVSTQDFVFEKSVGFVLPGWVKIFLALIIPFVIYIGFVLFYNQKSIQQREKPVY